jgi:hypothetical protein
MYVMLDCDIRLRTSKPNAIYRIAMIEVLEISNGSSG